MFHVWDVGAPWNSIVYDPELHTVYIGAGNGAPWTRQIRSPDGRKLFMGSSGTGAPPDGSDPREPKRR